MEEWVKAILYISNKLADCDEWLNMEIEGYAVSLKMRTLDAIEKVIETIEKKRRICNLKVLSDFLTEKLCDKDKLILYHFICGSDRASTASKLKISCATLFRRYTLALKRCCDALLSIGFNKEKLNEEFIEIPFMQKAVNRFSSPSERRCENGNELQQEFPRRRAYAGTGRKGNANAERNSTSEWHCGSSGEEQQEAEESIYTIQMDCFNCAKNQAVY